MTYKIDCLFETQHPGGTYACIIPSSESKEQLYAFCTKLGISNLVDADDYHCTVIYSKRQCPNIVDEDFGLPIDAMMKNLKILGEEKKVLVMELFCPGVKDLHQLFRRDYGATHDYESYIPHITLAEEFSGELPAEVFEEPIQFTGMTVEELS